MFRSPGEPERAVGLGCMRLSSPERGDDEAIAVIHAALDAGVRLLDTARAYGRTEGDEGHNERLVARALTAWSGDRGAVTIATKAGMKRGGGRWFPDARARSIEEDCERSAAALGFDVIPLLQLHAPDPRTPFKTAVRTLERLRSSGRCAAIGVCNVGAEELAIALGEASIASVQIALSPADDRAFRSGVVDAAIRNGVRILAHSPFGGPRRVKSVLRDPLLRDLAASRGVDPAVVALAWLCDLSPKIVPLPGASRVATAASLATVRAFVFDDAERLRLDERFTAAPRAVGRARRATPAVSVASGEVVLLMGIPGAGKSRIADAWEAEGYQRLNRDARGGRLSALLAHLDHGLVRGERRWILDNTYATRASRDEVVDVASRYGVPTRVVWLETPLGDAQVNACRRLVRRYGELPGPERLKELSRRDPHAFAPRAQFQFERELQPPIEAEGHHRCERVPFARAPDATLVHPATFIDLDAELRAAWSSAHRDAVARARADGAIVVGFAWTPEGSPPLPADLDLDVATCPHPGGPPVCWCRPPLPGLVVALAERHGIDLTRSTLIGRSPAAKTLASRAGMDIGHFDRMDGHFRLS